MSINAATWCSTFAGSQPLTIIGECFVAMLCDTSTLVEDMFVKHIVTDGQESVANIKK